MAFFKDAVVVDTHRQSYQRHIRVQEHSTKQDYVVYYWRRHFYHPSWRGLINHESGNSLQNNRIHILFYVHVMDVKDLKADFIQV